MTSHLYKGHLLKDAETVCICSTAPDCDALLNLGWCATTFLDDEQSLAVGFSHQSDADLTPAFKNKRVILFLHHNVTGRVDTGYLIAGLVMIALDIRVVWLPTGITVVGFLKSLDGKHDAAPIIERLIRDTVPLTSPESWRVAEALADIHAAIRGTRELHAIEKAVDALTYEFRAMQVKESARRLRSVEKK